MKLLCECGKEIEKKLTFNLKNFELDEFPVCSYCGRKWYLYILARESFGNGIEEYLEKEEKRK